MANKFREKYGNFYLNTETQPNSNPSPYQTGQAAFASSQQDEDYDDGEVQVVHNAQTPAFTGQTQSSDLPFGGDTENNTGILDTFVDAADAGYFNMASGFVKFVGDTLESDMLNEYAKELKQKAEWNTENPENFKDDNARWWANAVGNAVGSSVPTILASLGLAAASAVGGAAAGGTAATMNAANGLYRFQAFARNSGFLTNILKNVPGAQKAANAMSKLPTTSLGQLQMARLIGNVPESMSESGHAMFEADERGMTGWDRFKTKYSSLGGNLVALTAADLVGNAGENFMIGKFAAKNPALKTLLNGPDTSLKAMAARAALMAPVNGPKEGTEEYVQNMIHDTSLGDRFNHDQAWEEFKMGAAGGLVLGGVGGAITTKLGNNGVSMKVKDDEGNSHLLTMSRANGGTYEIDGKEVSAKEAYDLYNNNVKEEERIDVMEDFSPRSEKYGAHYGFGGKDSEYVKAQLGLEEYKASSFEERERLDKMVYNFKPSYEDIENTIKEWNKLKKENPERVGARSAEDITSTRFKLREKYAKEIGEKVEQASREFKASKEETAKQAKFEAELSDVFDSFKRANPKTQSTYIEQVVDWAKSDDCKNPRKGEFLQEIQGNDLTLEEKLRDIVEFGYINNFSIGKALAREVQQKAQAKREEKQRLEEERLAAEQAKLDEQTKNVEAAAEPAQNIEAVPETPSEKFTPVESDKENSEEVQNIEAKAQDVKTPETKAPEASKFKIPEQRHGSYRSVKDGITMETFNVPVGNNEHMTVNVNYRPNGTASVITHSDNEGFKFNQFDNYKAADDFVDNLKSTPSEIKPVKEATQETAKENVQETAKEEVKAEPVKEAAEEVKEEPVEKPAKKASSKQKKAKFGNEPKVEAAPKAEQIDLFAETPEATSPAVETAPVATPLERTETPVEAVNAEDAKPTKETEPIENVNAIPSQHGKYKLIESTENRILYRNGGGVKIELTKDGDKWNAVKYRSADKKGETKQYDSIDDALEANDPSVSHSASLSMPDHINGFSLIEIYDNDGETVYTYKNSDEGFTLTVGKDGKVTEREFAITKKGKLKIIESREFASMSDYMDSLPSEAFIAPVRADKADDNKKINPKEVETAEKIKVDENDNVLDYVEEELDDVDEEKLDDVEELDDVDEEKLDDVDELDDVEEESDEEKLDDVEDEVTLTDQLDNFIENDEMPEMSEEEIVKEVFSGPMGFARYASEDFDAFYNYMPLYKSNFQNMVINGVAFGESSTEAMFDSLIGSVKSHLNNGWKIVTGNDECIEAIKKGMPNVTNVEFDSKHNVMVLTYDDGTTSEENALTIFNEKTIVCPKSVFTLDTPVHEYTHVWWRIMEAQRPDIIKAIKTIIRGTKAYKDLEQRCKTDKKINAVYGKVKEEEVFCRLVGLYSTESETNKNSFESDLKGTPVERFRRAVANFLNKLFELLHIKTRITNIKTLHDALRAPVRDMNKDMKLDLDKKSDSDSHAVSLVRKKQSPKNLDALDENLKVTDEAKRRKGRQVIGMFLARLNFGDPAFVFSANARRQYEWALLSKGTKFGYITVSEGNAILGILDEMQKYTDNQKGGGTKLKGAVIQAFKESISEVLNDFDEFDSKTIRTNFFEKAAKYAFVATPADLNYVIQNVENLSYTNKLQKDVVWSDFMARINIAKNLPRFIGIENIFDTLNSTDPKNIAVWKEKQVKALNNYLGTSFKIGEFEQAATFNDDIAKFFTPDFRFQAAAASKIVERWNEIQKFIITSAPGYGKTYVSTGIIMYLFDKVLKETKGFNIKQNLTEGKKYQKALKGSTSRLDSILRIADVYSKEVANGERVFAKDKNEALDNLLKNLPRILIATAGSDIKVSWKEAIDYYNKTFASEYIIRTEVDIDPLSTTIKTKSTKNVVPNPNYVQGAPYLALVDVNRSKLGKFKSFDGLPLIVDTEAEMVMPGDTKEHTVKRKALAVYTATFSNFGGKNSIIKESMAWDYMFADEVHALEGNAAGSQDGKGAQVYNQLHKTNPNLRILEMSATLTPYVNNVNNFINQLLQAYGVKDFNDKQQVSKAYKEIGDKLVKILINQEENEVVDVVRGGLNERDASGKAVYKKRDNLTGRYSIETEEGTEKQGIVSGPFFEHKSKSENISKSIVSYFVEKNAFKPFTSQEDLVDFLNCKRDNCAIDFKPTKDELDARQVNKELRAAWNKYIGANHMKALASYLDKMHRNIPSIIDSAQIEEYLGFIARHKEGYDYKTIANDYKKANADTAKVNATIERLITRIFDSSLDYSIDNAKNEYSDVMKTFSAIYTLAYIDNQSSTFKTAESMLSHFKSFVDERAKSKNYSKTKVDKINRIANIVVHRADYDCNVLAANGGTYEMKIDPSANKVYKRLNDAENIVERILSGNYTLDDEKAFTLIAHQNQFGGNTGFMDFWVKYSKKPPSALAQRFINDFNKSGLVGPTHIALKTFIESKYDKPTPIKLAYYQEQRLNALASLLEARLDKGDFGIILSDEVTTENKDIRFTRDSEQKITPRKILESVLVNREIVRRCEALAELMKEKNLSMGEPSSAQALKNREININTSENYTKTITLFDHYITALQKLSDDTYDTIKNREEKRSIEHQIEKLKRTQEQAIETQQILKGLEFLNSKLLNNGNYSLIGDKGLKAAAYQRFVDMATAGYKFDDEETQRKSASTFLKQLSEFIRARVTTEQIALDLARETLTNAERDNLDLAAKSVVTNRTRTSRKTTTVVAKPENYNSRFIVAASFKKVFDNDESDFCSTWSKAIGEEDRKSILSNIREELLKSDNSDGKRTNAKSVDALIDFMGMLIGDKTESSMNIMEYTKSLLNPIFRENDKDDKNYVGVITGDDKTGIAEHKESKVRALVVTIKSIQAGLSLDEKFIARTMPKVNQFYIGNTNYSSLLDMAAPQDLADLEKFAFHDFYKRAVHSNSPVIISCVTMPTSPQTWDQLEERARRTGSMNDTTFRYVDVDSISGQEDFIRGNLLAARTAALSRGSQYGVDSMNRISSYLDALGMQLKMNQTDMSINAKAGEVKGYVDALATDSNGKVVVTPSEIMDRLAMNGTAQNTDTIGEIITSMDVLSENSNSDVSRSSRIVEETKAAMRENNKADLANRLAKFREQAGTGEMSSVEMLNYIIEDVIHESKREEWDSTFKFLKDMGAAEYVYSVPFMSAMNALTKETRDNMYNVVYYNKKLFSTKDGKWYFAILDDVKTAKRIDNLTHMFTKYEALAILMSRGETFDTVEKTTRHDAVAVSFNEFAKARAKLIKLKNPKLAIDSRGNYLLKASNREVPIKLNTFEYLVYSDVIKEFNQEPVEASLTERLNLHLSEKRTKELRKQVEESIPANLKETEYYIEHSEEVLDFLTSKIGNKYVYDILNQEVGDIAETAIRVYTMAGIGNRFKEYAVSLLNRINGKEKGEFSIRGNEGAQSDLMEEIYSLTDRAEDFVGNLLNDARIFDNREFERFLNSYVHIGSGIDIDMDMDCVNDKSTKEHLQRILERVETRYPLNGAKAIAGETGQEIVDVINEQNISHSASIDFDQDAAATAIRGSFTSRNRDSMDEFAKDPRGYANRFTREIYMNLFDKNDILHDLDQYIFNISHKLVRPEDSIYNAAQASLQTATGVTECIAAGDAKSIKNANANFALTGTEDELDEGGTLYYVLEKFHKIYLEHKERADQLGLKPSEDPVLWLVDEVAQGDFHAAVSYYLGLVILNDRYTHFNLSFTERRNYARLHNKKPPSREEKYNLPNGLTIETIRETLARLGWEFDVVDRNGKKELVNKMSNETTQLTDSKGKVHTVGVTRIIGGENAILKEVSDAYRQLTFNMLKFMHASGLIDRYSKEKMMFVNPDYAPLSRDMGTDADLSEFLTDMYNGGTGMANVSSPVRKIGEYGSTKEVFMPLETTLKSIAVSANRCIRNRVATMAVNRINSAIYMDELQFGNDLSVQGITGEELADRMREYHQKMDRTRPFHKVKLKLGKDGKPTVETNPNNMEFTVMIDGKKELYKVREDTPYARALYKAIVGYDPVVFEGIGRVAETAADFLRMGATVQPSFIARNFFRDTIFAGISSKHGFIPVVDSIIGMAKLLTDEEFRKEYESQGLSTFTTFGDVARSKENLNDIYRFNNKNWPKMMRSFTEAVRFFLRGNFYECAKRSGRFMKDTAGTLSFYYVFKPFSDLIEASTRAGEYRNAKKYADKTLTHEGMSEAEREAALRRYAATAARNVTLDFGRNGIKGRKWNRITPFFNASLQGADKARILFNEDPFWTMVKTMIIIVVPTIFLWLAHMAYLPEERHKMNASMKYTYWLIPKGNGEFLRLPKPQEFGIAFGSGIEMYLDASYYKDKDSWDQYKDELWNVFLPSVVPTIASPVLEWMTNYNFMTQRPIVTKRLEKLPQDEQYTPTTSLTSRGVSEWLAKHFPKISDRWKVSPLRLDNTIRGYSGSGGFVVWDGLSIATRKYRESPDKKWNEWLLARDFFGTDRNKTQDVTRYYAFTTHLDSLASSSRTDPEAVYARTAISRIRKYKINVSTEKLGNENSFDEKTIAGTNAEIRKIYDNAGHYAKWSSAEKRAKLLQLEDLVRAACRRVLEDYSHATVNGKVVNVSGYTPPPAAKYDKSEDGKNTYRRSRAGAYLVIPAWDGEKTKTPSYMKVRTPAYAKTKKSNTNSEEE